MLAVGIIATVLGLGSLLFLNVADFVSGFIISLVEAPGPVHSHRPVRPFSHCDGLYLVTKALGK